MQKHVAAGFVILLLAALTLAHADVNGVKVIIENRAPDGGTWITPPWIGFHNGTFDAFNMGASAGTELERLAEDGNAAPLSDLFDASSAGSAQGVIGSGPIAPGESVEFSFMLESDDTTNRYLSFASMVIPSNDAFIGNDLPTAHQIYDGGGNFLGGFITIYGSDVLDAGTEVNDEIPANTAFFGQTSPNTGVDENGTIAGHAGYLSAGSGGILDNPMFANADFTEAGYEVARITIIRDDTPVPAGNVSGTWSINGSPYLLEGEVTVPSGQTLVIEPGVVVFSQSWFGLHVQGTLEAVGTETDSILFTTTPVGFPPQNPGWKGVRFENADPGCAMAYCIMKHAKVTAGDAEARGAGVYSENSSPLIRNSTFHTGWAGVAGGAMYFIGGSPIIRDNLITDNFVGYGADGYGGAIYCVDAVDVEVSGNVISNNSIDANGSFPGGIAYARGGAIYLHDTVGEVFRNLIVNNSASAEGSSPSVEATGGAVHISSGSVDLRNNTIVGNECDYTQIGGGGGSVSLYGFYNLPVTVRNNIIANCIGGGIYFGDFTDTNSDVSYNDFFGNDIDFVEQVPPAIGDINTTNNNGDPSDSFFNIFLDPLFVDLSAGDYHLMASSPSVDAGDPASPADPDGTISDQGAFPIQQVTGVPQAVSGLTAIREDDAIRLSWLPVTLDTSGEPLEVTMYRIFRASSSDFDPPGVVVAEVLAPGTTWLDEDPFGGMNFYDVRAVFE